MLGAHCGQNTCGRERAPAAGGGYELVLLRLHSFINQRLWDTLLGWLLTISAFLRSKLEPALEWDSMVEVEVEVGSKGCL